jgi:hypothetical protein
MYSAVKTILIVFSNVARLPYSRQTISSNF